MVKLKRLDVWQQCCCEVALRGQTIHQPRHHIEKDPLSHGRVRGEFLFRQGLSSASLAVLGSVIGGGVIGSVFYDAGITSEVRTNPFAKVENPDFHR